MAWTIVPNQRLLLYMRKNVGIKKSMEQKKNKERKILFRIEVLGQIVDKH